MIFDEKKFFKGFKKSDLFQKVTEEIIEEVNNGSYDDIESKPAKDWNFLNGQIVGQETYNP